MARKKIGAIIALDGEREYKQAVTNCNRALNQFKAEMELVKAESEGQEDSLDSLGRKHEVLSKVLDAQKQKQEEVEKGLNHARESYDKMGGKLTALRDALEKATEKMKDMKEEGNASEEELNKQTQEVEELSKALEKSEANYEKAGNHIQKWETDLTKAKTETAKASNALNENARAMKEVSEESGEAAVSLEEVKEAAADGGKGIDLINLALGKVTSPMAIAAAGATALGAAFTKAAKESVQFAANMQTVSTKLQGATGATAAEMKKYEAALESIYKNNFGESLEDVANAMAKVKQYTGELDATELESMTENAMALEDVFDMDLSETIRGVNSLTKNMGITSKQAFDLMAKGAQNGLDKSGELGDNIAEYGQLWAQAGFSAEEMFAILQNGLDAGAYNLDKVNDFVKEFAISLSDGRIEENLDSFSDETQKLFWAMKNGKATSKDVFYSVVQDLKECTNKQEALTLASAVWSALGEDNAMAVITALGDVNDAYKDVGGTMESIKEISYDSVENKLEALGRKAKTEILSPIGEKALPLINEGIDAVGKVLDGVAEKINPPKTALQEFASEVKESNKQIEETLEKTKASMGNAEEEAGKLEVYKDTLLELNGVTKKTEFQKFQIKKIVEELSGSIPELAKAWDEESGSIKLTNDELIKLMENQEAYIIQQAALEAREETMKALYEAELNIAKAENAHSEAVQQLNEVTEKNKETMDYQRGGLGDLYTEMLDAQVLVDETAKSVENATEMQKQAATEYESTKKSVEAASEKLNEYVGVNEEAGEAVGNMAEAQSEAAKTIEDTSSSITDATGRVIEKYVNMRDSVTESLQSQMDMFSEFNAGQEISTSQLLENMQSQINGVTSWADNMEVLAKRGIDDSLLEHLAQLGPQGYEYVQAFVDATPAQLEEASDLWRQSLDFKSGTAEAVDSAIQAYTEGISGGTGKMKAAMEDLGTNSWKGFKEAINAKEKEAEASGKELMDVFYNAAQEEMEVHSPSRKMARLGKYTVDGLESGVKMNAVNAVNAVKSMTKKIVDTAKEELEKSTFAKNGRDVANGIADGIRTGKSAVIAEMQGVATEVSNAGNNMPDLYYEGVNLAYGLANGIYAGSSSVVNAVANMCASAVNEARNRLDIHSPSRVFEKLGSYTAEGFGIGYEKQIQGINRMIREEMDYSGDMNRWNGNMESSLDGHGGGTPEKLVIELPIYAGKEYTKTEIVEIALRGITQKQKGRLAARGVSLGAV